MNSINNCCKAQCVFVRYSKATYSGLPKNSISNIYRLATKNRLFFALKLIVIFCGSLVIPSLSFAMPPAASYHMHYCSNDSIEYCKEFNRVDDMVSSFNAYWKRQFDDCMQKFDPSKIYEFGYRCKKPYITKATPDYSDYFVNGLARIVYLEQWEYRIDLAWYPGQQEDKYVGNAEALLNWNCPNNLAINSHWEGNNYIVDCATYYKAALVNTINPINYCAGNPIDIASGFKIQQEEDLVSSIPFSRIYNNANSSAAAPKWRNTFNQKIKILDPQTDGAALTQSDGYKTKNDACVLGWLDIQRATGKSRDTRSRYTCDVCEITRNDITVAILPIVESSPMPGASQPVNTLIMERPEGNTITFQRNCNNEWQASIGNNKGLLNKNADGSWQFALNTGAVEHYSAEGQLQQIVNGSSTQTLSYNGSGLLSTVKDSNGHQLDFDYLAGQLSSVTLDRTEVTRYQYSQGLINKVIRPDNSSRQYHYENTAFPQALTGITNENGVRFATWKYDTQGRAISSEHAGGAEKTSLTFNTDGSTTVTNTLGKKTTYNFVEILGIKRVYKVTGEPTTNCLGANQNYTYNTQGLLDTQTDWKGNITKFEYDTKGREISKTTAFTTLEAATTKTCWHSTFNQPSRIIEPDQITVFDYWPTGQLKTTSTKPRPTGTVDCSTAL